MATEFVILGQRDPSSAVQTAALEALDALGVAYEKVLSKRWIYTHSK